MSLFDSLSNKQQQKNPFQLVEQLKTNPWSTLREAGLNIPEGMHDPQQIINYLLQSGQVNSPRFQMAQQLAGRLFRR